MKKILLIVISLILAPYCLAQTEGQGLASKKIVQTKKRTGYDITVNYPQYTDPKAQVVNQQIRTFVNGFIAAEKKEGMRQISAEYKVTTVNSRLLSVTFNIESDSNPPGAHPSYTSSIFNYDLQKGARLRLSDLFKPNSHYLKVISDYCLKALPEKLGSMSDPNWIKDGAGPTLKNYTTWNVDKEGLLITFQPYQVAAYAAGPQEVVIPYSALKSIINSQGPLASL